MIFSGKRIINGKEVTHIEMILNGIISEDKRQPGLIVKTETRRLSERYKVGRDYALQQKRGGRGLIAMRLFIDAKWNERKGILYSNRYQVPDIVCYQNEGGYSPQEYELLFEKMYPGWDVRWAYRFHLLIDKHHLKTLSLLLKPRPRAIK